MDKKNNQTADRLKNYLSIFGRKYPAAWKQFDEFRALRGTSPVFEWNDWCFCPLAGAYAIVSGGGAIDWERAGDVGLLGGLAAWRATQGIYRFDETVFEEVWQTPVLGDLPVEILYRFPEWCVYVETPGKTFAGEKMSGFFAFLDDDRKNLRDELRLILDTEKTGLINIPIHLQKTGLRESLKSVSREAAHQAGINLDFDKNIPRLERELEPVLSLILYLCSQVSEIDNFKARRMPDYNKRKKRLFPPHNPTKWEVGARVGAAIRHARNAGEQNSDAGGGSAKRPHIRRAHWHGFWSGRRTGSEKQKFQLKWLPPMNINVEDENPVIPTIREVE